MLSPAHHLADEDTLRVLEFPAIRQQLVDAAVTPYGRARAESLRPAAGAEEVEERQAATAAAVRVLRRGSDPLGSLPDVRPVLARVEKGAQAAAGELALLRDFLAGVRQVREHLHRGEAELEVELGPLAAWSRQLAPCVELLASLERSLDEDGELRDQASPRLRSLRQGIARRREGVRRRLEAMTRSAVHEPHLQEPLVTRRQGRYVLPVKAGARDQLPGIVHDRSASGQTLFVEPLAVVEANNQVVELERQEEREVARILTALSAAAAAQAEALAGNAARMGDLDLALACGRLSRRQDAVAPELNSAGRLRIKGGRHPLLQGEPVPIDLELGGSFHTLVITGPNTGGKTVTLKTVGLFTLMAQAGLHVPAEPGTELAVFNRVCADIGDEQSIEQSLSTFSGHMQRIVRFVGEADPASLVLLDELGAGTDPEEGAALAMALLDHFHQVGARTVATTHFSQLKTYAYRREGVENASVQFDVETLAPTFRLKMGLPGTSNAFAIAARLGLAPDIIARARSFVSEDQAEVARLIREMEEDRRLEEEARERAARELAESQRLRRQAAAGLAAAEAEGEQLLARARDEARETVKEATREAETVVAELRRLARRLAERLTAEPAAGEGAEAAAALPGAEAAIGEARRRLRRRLSALRDPQPTAPGPPPEELREGTPVRVRTLGRRRGTVLREPEGGEVEVQLGGLRVTVPLEQLEAVPENERETPAEARPSSQRRWRLRARRDVALSCMVRGMSVEEARERVDRYLDRAFLAGREQVVIIHGKGTGTLRRTLRAFMDEHPHVEGWAEAPPAEGGAGATVVRLVPRRK